MDRASDEKASFIAVDVGNTSTSIGLFLGIDLLATWEIATPSSPTDDEAFAAVSSSVGYMARKAGLTDVQLEGSILSCVVPAQTMAWRNALREVSGVRALVVGPGLKTGLRMKYRDPAEIGSDRIADIAAAAAFYGGPCIVVDLGTTTNFEVLDAEGSFIGGIIAPGMELGASSLADHAAKLPQVEVVAPRSVLGTCTREAMQSGVALGEVARIDGLIGMIEDERPADYRIVVAGAAAEGIASLLTRDADVDRWLTLRGLAVLYGRNAKGKTKRP